MKKWITVVLLVSIAMIEIIAQDVISSLDAANKLYLKGDYASALQQIQIAKEQIEKEQMLKNGNTYLDIPSWNVIKASPVKYNGMKIKTIATFVTIATGGTVFISPIGMWNIFPESLADKIGSLQSYKKYTWSGEVFIDDLNGVLLKIENVE